MTHELLTFAHLVGLMLIAAGLLGVFVFDLRSRAATDLVVFGEAVRNIGVFYDGLVVPGALLLAGSGAWLIVEFFGGWGFVEQPWLLGMVVLFLFEFVEGNTVTRVYFMRLRAATKRALVAGRFTDEVEALRGGRVATFTHFLDLPLLLVIVALGALRPADWTTFAVGSVAAVVTAAVLTVALPRLAKSPPPSEVPRRFTKE